MCTTGSIPTYARRFFCRAPAGRTAEAIDKASTTWSTGAPWAFARARSQLNEEFALTVGRSSPLIGVLFDLDGTMIDSEPVWGRANRGLAASRNAELTEDILAELSGLDSTLAMELMHARFGWSEFDVDRDVTFIQQQVHQAYTAGVHWLPGTRELLAALRRSRHRFKTGLVTSTYRALVDIVLDELAPDSFDVVVCGDDGHEPKPHPAPYQHAITALDIPTSACVAIEDSRRGVASAYAAGCAVLNVSSTRFDLADAHRDSLVGVLPSDLEAILARPVDDDRLGAAYATAHSD